MKHLTISIIVCSLTTLVFSQTPLLVGHRGSVWGVENSEEAFFNGANMGYHALEADIRVTADSQFVICHDEDLKRFGYPDIKIAESTLEQLKTLNLTQQRDGEIYQAEICTLDQYLEICQQQGCFPVIELKWSLGINENDKGLLPKLLQQVSQFNLTNHPIYLSSMKKCLALIRELQPNATIQLLAYERNLAECIEWCLMHRLDIDLAKFDSLNAALVKQLHNQGIKVNVWTINTEDEYKKYLDANVDFITTDKLKSH